VPGTAPAPSSTAAAPNAPLWTSNERPLGVAARAQLRRLTRRARPSWPIWVAAAAVVSAALTVHLARQPPKYTVTVALRASEGTIRTQSDFGVGDLRAHMKDLVFTRSRLADLLKRHAAYLGKDPDAAYEELIDHLKVEIVLSDIIYDERDSDPPRSARVTLSFTGWRPQVVWQIPHDLADLLIDSALARQRAALLRDQTAARSAVGRAQATSDDAPVDATAADRRSLLDRIKATEAKAAAAQLGVRAGEEKQGLRFELVDPGRMPKVGSRTWVIGAGIGVFVIVLLAVCLLVGAFDPRVLNAGDLTDLGVPLLGRLPPLPAPPSGPPESPRNAPEASPPSADRGARV